MEENNKPNIVFFMVDQLSARWLEAGLDGACHTPNIDGLLEDGVNFTNTVSSNPVCVPTRSTIATGQTTRGHGVLENAYRLDPEFPTFMRALREGGWRTGAFGKVHVRPHFAGLYPDYNQYGFEETHVTEDPRGGEWLDWVKKEHPEHYEDALATIWASSLPEYENYGPRGVNIRDRIKKVRSNYNWTTEKYPENTSNRYTLPFPKEISQTEWITGHALDFIGRIPEEEPIFAHISYVQPHEPSCPPEEYMERVDPDKIPAPAPAEWADDPNVNIKRHSEEPELADWKHARHCYFADISHLDHQLGLIIDALERAGRMDNTYLIFLSDHGDLLFDHGFCNKEERHYDACIRVPLIVRGPDLKKKGLEVEKFVQHEDICPTVLDMASLSFPDMPKQGPYLDEEPGEIETMAGSSLLDLCRGGKPEAWREAAYSESYNYIGSNDPGDWARTVRTDRYRYTYYPRGNGEQLFDLKEDPQEVNNLVGDSGYQSIRNELRDILIERIIMQDFPKTRRDLFALGVH